MRAYLVAALSLLLPWAAAAQPTAVGSQGTTLAAPPSERLTIANVMLIDGNGQPPMRADVEVQGGRITAVRPGSGRASSDGRIIDGTGRYMIPGLIDSHVHLAALQPYRGEPAALFAWGLTTVRDMGGVPTRFLRCVIRWRPERGRGRRSSRSARY